MTLDPQVKELVNLMEAEGAPPIASQSPEEARRAYKDMKYDEEVESVHEVQNRIIPSPDGDIPVRVYLPEGKGPHPALLFFHGGGWVIGDIDTHDNVSRALTNLADCVVVSVDYRLAPEAKFPAAVDDCYAATLWVSENASEFNIDPSRIAVGGDSAGGNLTAVISYLSRENGLPKLVHQLLFYPATDFTADNNSRCENATGYFLTIDDINYFSNHYLDKKEDYKNPLASPFLIDNLTGLPPATVITAEYDPLRDEGEAYAKRLKEAGVPVTLTRYDGMIHGFVVMASQLDKGKLALKQAAASLKKTFEKK